VLLLEFLQVGFFSKKKELEVGGTAGYVLGTAQ